MSYSYDDTSIQDKGISGVRLRPASMLGSDGIDGARHTVTEIMGNALDEAIMGYGKKFDVCYYKDNAISVRDFGRGVPLGFNKNTGKWNWDSIYNSLYAGGKYDDSQERLKNIKDWDSLDWDYFLKNFNYLFSVGLNGLGGACTQVTSRYFEVCSYRDGKCSRMYFENGLPALDELEVTDTNEPDGTYIKWLPDETVFTDAVVTGQWVYELFHYTIHLTGLKLHFRDEQTGVDVEEEGQGLEYIYKEKFKDIAFKNPDTEEFNTIEISNINHGLTLGKKKRIDGVIKDNQEVYVCKVDILLTPLKESRVESIHSCFHNTISVKAGIQYEAIATAISMFFVELSKAKGIKLEYSDYNKAFGVVLSSYSNIVSYVNQTKDEIIETPFLFQIIRDSIYDRLKVEYSKGTSFISSVVDDVFDRARIRAELENQRKILKAATKTVSAKKLDRKFNSCRSYDDGNAEETEFWIPEGDSAGDNIILARNSDFQCVFPLMGKIINVLKQPLEKVINNTIVKNVFNILGTGFDLGFSDDTFDITKLKAHKIIIATDADEDGYQIRVLAFLMFYRLAPQLISNGHVYIAETPLFRVFLNDGGIKYMYDKAELEEFRNGNAYQIKDIQRFKGLGEMSKDMLRETTVLPENRRLTQLKMDLSQNQKAQDIINMLFGLDKYSERKSFLKEVFGITTAQLIEEGSDLLTALGGVDEVEVED